MIALLLTFISLRSRMESRENLKVPPIGLCEKLIIGRQSGKISVILLGLYSLILFSTVRPPLNLINKCNIYHQNR